MKKIGILAIIVGGVVAIAVTAAAIAWFVVGQPKPSSPIAPSQIYDSYAYGTGDEARIIDLGAVPTAFVVSFITECLQHDRILEAQLAARGWKLRTHGYRTGADMSPYLDGRLDFLTVGDIPALMAAAKGKIGIFQAVSINTMTVVANKRMTAQELKGKKMGYITGTVTHFGVYRTLQIGGVSPQDVTGVQVLPDKMPSALKDGTVDAGTSYEPFTSLIQADLPGSAVISRYDTYSFVCFASEFAKRHPDLTQLMMAAVYRATRWAALSDENLKTGLAWVRDAQIAFLGSSSIEPREPWLGMLRKDTIANPSYPMLPLDFTETTSMQHQEFEFLKEVGLIDGSVQWQTLIAQVHMELLPAIIKEGGAWEIDHFDYGIAAK